MAPTNPSSPSFFPPSAASRPTTEQTPTGNHQIACSWIGVDNVDACLSIVNIGAGSMPSTGTGSIPTELGMLTQLTRLDLFTSNTLSGSIPTQLGMLTQLTNFQLFTNALTAFDLYSSCIKQLYEVVEASISMLPV